MGEREATFIGEPHEACLEPPTKPATYKHQPLSRSLDEIRLIKLRREKEGPVRCEIQAFPLKRAPKYIALSYRWGSPLLLHNIFIGDQTLEIRDILNSCLLELREDVHTWLWIDQICIAQADTTERNHQVGMMSRIYSNATSVIIWLSDVPLAPPGEVDHFNDQNLDDLSVVTLLRNSYFTRLWIIQEVLLAKQVRFHLNGNRCFTWDTLSDAYCDLDWGLKESASIPTASRSLMANRGVFGMRPRLHWTKLIDGFSANACVDPRDKVYGMMGVVVKEERSTVDYNKSVAEVFFDVMYALAPPDTKDRRVLERAFYKLGPQMSIDLSLIRNSEWLFNLEFNLTESGVACKV